MLSGRVELCQVWLRCTLLLGRKDCADVLRQDLAEFDAPLIKAVDIVEESLNSDTMLVEREELAAFLGIELPTEQNA